MSRIAQTFADLRAHGRMAFMPFITAGDPDLAFTQTLLRELGSRGVDLIEVGFPYSDPIADGPVIQSSYTRALARKLHVGDIFASIAELQTDSLPPLCAMVSYAIVFRAGPDRFLEQAAQAGFSGLIVPDLPGDEAQDLFDRTRSAGLNLIQLVAPTTPRPRVRAILQHCSGFVYCIAVAGTTGAREHIAGELAAQLRWLREETDLPLCVGFGISRPEHIDPLRGLADGAIVGSAIVSRLHDLSDGRQQRNQVAESIGQFAGQMAATAHQVPGG
jgi:tryptophan synthase alpha chain